MRVFVFCIGGTGLRVMKSITMLLAAGADTHGYKVVPVLVDPHQDLDERKNLNTLIDDYIKIFNISVGRDGRNNRAENPLDGFFGTEIERLSEIDNQQNPTADNNAYQKSFGDYLNVNSLSTDDDDNFLIQTLFSSENLSNKLSVGFKGNPNVGTVVLEEQLEGADWYDAFRRHCDQNDRVFIISSIFGGTGASGYPLLEKKIRNDKDHPAVCGTIMGAVSVLPYFRLDDPTTTGSSIDSANFLTKTKSALTYYENTVTSDYLYYVGDSSMKAQYENSEIKQDDKAHFIELVAASALFDFLSRPKPDTKQCMSRAIREDMESLNLEYLGDGYRPLVKDITNFKLLQHLCRSLPLESHFPLSQSFKLDKDFYDGDDFKRLLQFIDCFYNWYSEMEQNKRSFSPLSSEKEQCQSLDKIIVGHKLKAKNLSWYWLEMIKVANNSNEKHIDYHLRNLLDISYQAIIKFTENL